MRHTPRVPFDTLEDISATRCEPPVYYRKNDLKGPVHLDVPVFPPASEWTAVNLLMASRLTHRAAARFSWACVRISNDEHLESLIRTVEEAHIYPGENRPMRDHIHCLELWSNGRNDWSIPQLFSQSGENVPNLEILIIPDCLWCLDIEQPFMRLESDNTPFPFPFLFPSSLDALLLTSTERAVSIVELTMISIQAPNLTRLQVAAFCVSNRRYDEAQVAEPSYRFRRLEWLAVGAMVMTGPDERPQSSFLLSNLLEGLSRGSGMPRLRRFDILGVCDVPRIFSDLHADTMEVVTIPSTKRPSMHWTPFSGVFDNWNTW
ncbi:hypothetical protein DFP72DRAFT_1075738 [Ephemerocybe angulata]|uniref:Uncharacterized protein n=1 Tax=Ephemerocybe angulata TaxID=980116 RepID=A0A8H6M0B2_9AGAR|nr:hypothetical protein DFP72DRAFT_1075738 [Tulosesus angulatus]